MKFNCDLFQELTPGKISLTAGTIAPHPTVVVQGQMESRAGAQQADFDMHFSGFQMLETDEQAVHLAESAGLGKFLLSGIAVIAFSKHLFDFGEGEDCNTEMSQEMCDEWADFVSVVVAGSHGIPMDVPLIIRVDKQVTTEDKYAFQFITRITRAIPEEDWHKTFAVKSLELSAAARFWQAQGNEMAIDPVLIPDLAADRTLN